MAALACESRRRWRGEIACLLMLLCAARTLFCEGYFSVSDTNVFSFLSFLWKVKKTFQSHLNSSIVFIGGTKWFSLRALIFAYHFEQ